MAPKSGTRAALPSTTRGLGQHFTSPRRRRNVKKSQTLVEFPGRNLRRERLLARIEELRSHKHDSSQTAGPSILSPEMHADALPMDDGSTPMEFGEDIDVPDDHPHPVSHKQKTYVSSAP